MTARVRAVTPQQYDEFISRRKADIKAADAAAQVQRKRLEASGP